MTEYCKIPNIYVRDAYFTRKIVEGEYTSEVLEQLAGITWVWTEKVDGTNIRVFWDGHRVTFGGRTDKAQIPAELVNYLQEKFGSVETEEIFEQLFGEKEVILFGEGFGGKIQAAGPKYGETRFVLFDVMVNGKYLDRENVYTIGTQFQVEIVPAVGIGTLPEAVEFVKMHKQSHFGDIEMEGIVCRPVFELMDGNGKRIIVKIKARDFPKEADA